MKDEEKNPVLLLTRPMRQAKRFQAACEANFGLAPRTLISPLMEIQARLQFVLPDEDTTLIISSENALDALFQRADLTGRRAICVGEVTTKSALGYGLAASFGGRSVDELLKFILTSGHRGPFVHMRGAYTTGNLVDELELSGFNAKDCIVYDQIARPLTDGARAVLKLERCVVLPLFSQRSAHLFFAMEPTINTDLKVVAISPAVAEAVAKPFKSLVAKEPTAAEIISIIKVFFSGH